jgi:A/G-specific adenine glycosylase
MVRGALLAILRASDAPVERSALDAVPAEPGQRERCLDSLVADGLVEPLEDGFFRLPGERRAS